MCESVKSLELTDVEIELIYLLLDHYRYELINLPSDYKEEFPDTDVMLNCVKCLLDKFIASGSLQQVWLDLNSCG